MTRPQPKTGQKTGPTSAPTPRQQDIDLWEEALWGAGSASPVDASRPSHMDGPRSQNLGACLRAILSEIGLCAQIARELDAAIGGTDAFRHSHDAGHNMTLQNLDLLCQLLEGVQCYADGLTTASARDANINNHEIYLDHLAPNLMLAAQRARLLDGTAETHNNRYGQG
ncbi:hypothetical protein OE810_05710 [Rhodobacteraceae bacterium XHP0102]|nr:hypothetical protein [Rhodobacteraceae bacterium XHP0102]